MDPIRFGGGKAVEEFAKQALPTGAAAIAAFVAAHGGIAGTVAFLLATPAIAPIAAIIGVGTVTVILTSFIAGKLNE